MDEASSAPDPSSSSGLPPVGELAHSVSLVHRFRGGDETALNELFDRYYDRVRRIAKIRMGSRLSRLTESDDIVQNTFATAFQKIGELELREHASIIQYLSRILEHQIRDAVDYFGAQKRNAVREVPLSTEASDSAPALELVDRAPQPVDQVASRELRDIYDACVQSLAPDHREVILLKEYAHASWPEIAAALERPTVHAAHELYGRAQMRLGRCLRRKLGP